RGAQPQDVRYHRGHEPYKARIALKRALGPGLVKPNPQCLRDIMNTFGVAPEETVYVGDSLHKDVWMAQMCGVHDVYAAYGRQVDKEHYRQLVEISHRTAEEVSLERQPAGLTVKPSVAITSFAELLEVVRKIE